jgi:uncharacterized protein (TIGR01777 family)
MKILITGATGFIGRRLAAKLVLDGHSVAGLSRTPEEAARMAPAVSFSLWHSGEMPPAEAIRPADAIIHLAGESVNGRWTARKKRAIADSRVEGTRNLVSALAAEGAGKTLISASAVGFYGDRGDAELVEESGAGTGFLAEVTQDWEGETFKAEAAGCRVAVMRFGIVLGPEGGALATMLPLFRFGLGGPLGGGRQWWPWVHVDDVVSALAAGLTNPWSGVFNLTSPQPVRQQALASALGEAVHRPAFAPVPGFVLRLVQGEFADEILFSKRVIPARLLEAGFRFRHPAIGPAFRQLLGQEAAGAALQPHT